MPVVYYGDEQGFTGDGGDQDARQDMMPSHVGSYNDDDLIGTTATTADANFDDTHPLYQTLADYGALLDAHPALTRGAQLHRYSEGSAGIYAFSRIERTEQVEYVVGAEQQRVGRLGHVRHRLPGDRLHRDLARRRPGDHRRRDRQPDRRRPGARRQGVPRRRRHRRAGCGSGGHDDRARCRRRGARPTSRSARRCRRPTTPR